MKYLISLLLVCMIGGCAFMACGDRGVDSKYGFLWLKYKCNGDNTANNVKSGFIILMIVKRRVND